MPSPFLPQVQSQLGDAARSGDESRDLADRLAAQVESLAGALAAKTEAELVSQGRGRNWLTSVLSVSRSRGGKPELEMYTAQHPGAQLALLCEWCNMP
jgi:hypothetical protein